MDKYVFDSNVFIDLFNNYYESRFPTLWENFYELVLSGKVISVREVKNELESYFPNDRLKEWVTENKQLFELPNEVEISYVKDIFKVEHFRSLIETKKILKGKPVADPFLIVKAKVIGGYVVTQEKYKENSAKIPNICEYLEVPVINLEGFMENENWKF